MIKKIIAGSLMVAVLLPNGSALAASKARTNGNQTQTQGHPSSGKGVVANREQAAKLVRLLTIIAGGGRGTVVEAPTPPKPPAKPKDEPATPKKT